MQDVVVGGIRCGRIAGIGALVDAVSGSAALALALSACMAWGQGAKVTGPNGQDDSVAPATTSIEPISVDLVVHDKSHKPYASLRPEDIQILDNEKPVTLKDLRRVTAEGNSEHVVTFVSDRFGGTLSKNEQSIAGKILKELPAKGYSFAVLDLVPRLRLIQAFTTDRNAVRDAMRAVTEGPKSDKNPVIELTASNAVYQKAIVNDDDASSLAAKKAERNLVSIVRTGADSDGTHFDATTRARYKTLLDAMQASRQVQQDRHTLPSLAALMALVRSQEKIAARKCIIYFTQNMQMDSAAKEMIRSIAEAANQAGVTLYVVDMDALDVGGRHQIDNALAAQNVAFNPAPVPVEGSGGLAMRTPSLQRGPGGPSSNAGMAVDWLRQSDRNPFGDVHSPMADMARETGGAYIDAQDNVKNPLQQLIDDMSTYYVATYVPPIDGYDGTFRSIEFRPRRKGLTVNGRTGYYAVDPGASGGVRAFEAPLLKILAEEKLPTEVKFKTAVLHFGEMAEGNTNSAAIEIPIDQLETKTDQHTNLFSAHVSVVGQVKDANGTVVEHFAEDVAHRAAVETIKRDKNATINVTRHFPVTPGKYTLEVAVLDRLSDKAGAQRMSFEVPPNPSGPSISDVVLVRKVEGGRSSEDPDEPLTFEKGLVTPNVVGDVPEGAKSVSLFFIVHPDGTSKDPVKVEMEVGRNGRAGKRTVLPIHFDTAQAAVPYLASFNSGLAPGDYKVKALVTQGASTATRELAFTVEGEENAAAENPVAGLHSDAADTAMPAGDLPKGALAIVPATNAVQAPSPEEVKQLVADTRERALHYVDSLPNFVCIEVTSRSYDPTGAGRWKLRDTVTELLRYHDKSETRTMIEIDGKPASNAREGMKGTFSSGELGGVLRAVFADKANADFQWKETDTLGAATVQVFDYHVEQKNSEFSVVGMDNRQVMVGFHGQAYIDAAAHNVRRITLIADDMPKDFPTHYTSIGVDYDYVSINNHDYLMPSSAQLRLKQGRHEAVMNNIEFRNYRRFGSSVRILPETPEAGAAPGPGGE
ncbi:VWA domain-containing protein [Occallatibacter savannae]|uniref:VWA domain-containing protein n=1 Tax=Occallatibacter savannae TaxID=1002691 RepID=UPI000D689F41|nr:VWA domain-containing protein [Occallatibacter savannae]